jgi:hypothetical protein
VALANAPAGGGGDGVWTEVEKDIVVAGILAVQPPGGTEPVTVTVTAGGEPVEAGTRVEIRDRNSGTIQDFGDTTGVSNVVTLSADVGDWTLRAYKQGVYQSHSADLAVPIGGTAVAVAMVALPAIETSPAGFVTGYWTAYDKDGNEAEGLTHYLQVQRGPGTAGVSLPSGRRAAVSGAGGLVQVPGIPHGSQVVIWRGSSDKRGPYLAPSTGETWAIDEVLGDP